MTRASPTNLLYELDPEIERTRQRLRRQIQEAMADHPAGQNLPAGNGGLPPPPGLRQLTVRDFLEEDLNGLNPGVVTPEIEATHFELKPVMFNMLNTIGQFGGSVTEDARQHLKSFMEICNSFKIQGVHEDVLRLKLLPYSLRDRAKTFQQD